MLVLFAPLLPHAASMALIFSFRFSFLNYAVISMAVTFNYLFFFNTFFYIFREKKIS